MNGAGAKKLAYRGLVAILACTLILACNKRPSTSETSGASSSFPGYQQVGQAGDAAQLWFNSGAITRKEQGYVIHTLKTLSGGYARFDVVTNCRDSIRRLPGTQYNSDGTAGTEYPGNDTPVAAKTEPGMTELISAACTIALGSRAIPGEFSASAALELLYGPYDAQKKVAIWTDAAVPADLPWGQNLMGTEPFYVMTVGTFDFADAGKQKKLWVTSAARGDGTCHACTGLLGMTTFVKDGSSWRVESNDPYVASLGNSGSVGDELKGMPSGDDGYALVILGEDFGQGYQTRSADVFLREGGKYRHVISDQDTGASDQESLTVDAVFLKGKNPQHFDFNVTFTYSMPGQKTYVANHVYEYVGDKYVLVKKDGPPKFVMPPSGTTSATGLAPAPSPVVPPAVSSGACTTVDACVNQMLAAARTTDLPGALQAADAMGGLPKPARGDRAKARKLNGDALVALNKQDAPAAVQLLAAAAAADPGDVEVQANLAYAYTLTGNFPQAVKTTNQALILNPKRANVWSTLSVTFAKMQDRTRALEAMWLAFQFSGDKQKTLDSMMTRLRTETDPDIVRLFAESLAWFTQNKTPAGL